jgi:F-type H+-transporting ATPase subunit delta
MLDRLVPEMPPVVRNFTHILVERDRLEQVPDIAEAFRERVNRERGILTAEVTTAIPLDEGMERSVAQKLGVYLDHDPRRLVIRSRVDPDIIGGVVARIGDTLIDDSVRGRLERLRRVLGAP